MKINHELIRINTTISKMNYERINELKKSMPVGGKLSKGMIIDIALTGLFQKLEQGDDLNQLAMIHLESINRGDSE